MKVNIVKDLKFYLEKIFLFSYFFSIMSFIVINRRIYFFIQLIFILYFFFKFSQPKNFILNKFSIWYLVFTIWSLFCSVLINMYFDKAFYFAIFQLLIFSIFLYPILKNNRENIMTCYYALFLGGLYFSLYILYKTPYIFWGKVRLGNYNSIASPIIVGAIVATSLSVIVYLYYLTNNKFLLLVSLLFVFVILISGTRKHIINIVMIYGCLFILKRNKNKNYLYYFSIPIILFIILFILYKILLIPFFYDSIGMRISDAFETIFMVNRNQGIDDSTVDRIQIAKQAFEMIKNNPLTGVGLGNFNKYSNASHAHNNYLDLAATVGLIGLIIYYSIYFLILKKLIQRKCGIVDRSYIFHLINIITILMISFFASTYSLEQYFYLLFFAYIESIYKEEVL